MHNARLFAVLLVALACGDPAPPETTATDRAPAAALPAEPDSHGIQAIEVRGNLVSEKPLDCVATSEVTPSHTPADIYPAVSKCLAEKRVREAVGLYSVAYAYAMFDMQRVSDPTAHQAKDVLELQAFAPLSEAARGELIAAVQAAGPGTEASARVCAELERLGPPSYEPRYMISHGTAAVSETVGPGAEVQQGTTPDFDPAAAWADVLANRMKCG